LGKARAEFLAGFAAGAGLRRWRGRSAGSRAGFGLY